MTARRATQAEDDAFFAEFRDALRDDPLFLVEVVEFVTSYCQGEKPILPKSTREYVKIQAERAAADAV